MILNRPMKYRKRRLCNELNSSMSHVADIFGTAIKISFLDNGGDVWSLADPQGAV